MKRSLFIGWIILVVAFSYGCTKKQNLPEKQSTEADVSVQNNDSMNRKPFKFTITTDIDEESDDETDIDEEANDEDVKIIISMNKLDGKQTILYDLDCESDGEYEFTGLSDDHECIYKPNTGTHQISVRGEIPGLYLCARHPNEEVCARHPNEDACIPNYKGFICDISSGEDASSVALKSIDSWGDISWKSMFAFAADCERLEIIPDEVPDLSHVKNMSYMFSGAESFNQPLENWDVSNVTDMSMMFSDADSFNQPLEKWNVSKVTDMSGMFWGADSFNQPLEKWDVSKVTNMSRMFSWASSFNQPLEKWNVSNVTNMSEMFRGASKFSYYPKSWVVPEKSEDMFTGTKVEDIAEKEPLKRR